MKAVMVDEPGALRVVDIPEPEPGPDDVVVRVGACGICGTDVHIIDGEFPPTVYPIVIGHEFGGEVTAVGENVKGFSSRRQSRRRSDPELWRLLLLPAGHGQSLRAVECRWRWPSPGWIRGIRLGSRARGLPHPRRHVDEGRGVDRTRLLCRARFSPAAAPNRGDLPHLRRRTDGAAQRPDRQVQRREPGGLDRHQSEPARARQERVRLRACRHEPRGLSGTSLREDSTT